MFCCAETGREFDSGFRGTAEELNQIPADYKMTMRCSICRKLHPFTISEVRVSDEPAGPAL